MDRGSTVCYANSFTLYKCRFYTSQQTGWVRWCGWRAQSEGRCNKVNSNATIVWKFFLHWWQHNALSSVNISPQLSVCSTHDAGKGEVSTNIKQEHPERNSPRRARDILKHCFMKFLFQHTHVSLFFFTVWWHEAVVASLWRCKRHIEKISV